MKLTALITCAAAMIASAITASAYTLFDLGSGRSNLAITLDVGAGGYPYERRCGTLVTIYDVTDLVNSNTSGSLADCPVSTSFQISMSNYSDSDVNVTAGNLDTFGEMSGDWGYFSFLISLDPTHRYIMEIYTEGDGGASPFDPSIWNPQGGGNLFDARLPFNSYTGGGSFGTTTSINNGEGAVYETNQTFSLMWMMSQW
jgi:hypothetical protein